MADDRVVLRIPAAGAYVSVLRTTTASLASRLDFTVDDIEDLRIAVDEACALLLPQASNGASLECVFDLTSSGLAIAVSVDAVAPALPDKDSFAWTVLSALVGHVTSEVGDGRVTLLLVKDRVASA